jgi:hypothetical protein
MKNPESDRDTSPLPPPIQRDVYREVVVPPVAPATRTVYQEHVPAPVVQQVVRTEHVSSASEATRRGSNVTRIKQVIYFVFGAINVLLVIRFVLLLLGASEESSFVNLIYGLSRAFILPFRGIFAEPTLGTSVFEWASLVAMIVYSLIAYGLARMVELLYAPVRPTVTGGS